MLGIGTYPHRGFWKEKKRKILTWYLPPYRFQKRKIRRKKKKKKK